MECPQGARQIYAMQLLQFNTRRSRRCVFFFFFFFLTPILLSYWFKNALEYKLFLQTSIVTFVKCLLLSSLKVKTMKYYLICNPRKCPKTTCLSLETCQNKVRGKVEPENNNLRLLHVAPITGWACGLHSGFQLLREDLHLFSLTHMGVLGFEIDNSNSLIVATQHFFKKSDNELCWIVITFPLNSI